MLSWVSMRECERKCVCVCVRERERVRVSKAKRVLRADKNNSAASY